MKPSFLSQTEQSTGKEHISLNTSEDKSQGKSVGTAFYKMKAFSDIIPLERMCREALNVLTSPLNASALQANFGT